MKGSVVRLWAFLPDLCPQHCGKCAGSCRHTRQAPATLKNSRLCVCSSERQSDPAYPAELPGACVVYFCVHLSFSRPLQQISSVDRSGLSEVITSFFSLWKD